MSTAIRVIFGALLLFLLFGLIATLAHACERYHYDGHTLWCCSATEARPCVPLKGVGAEVRT